jgi:hypothetical protein
MAHMGVRISVFRHHYGVLKKMTIQFTEKNKPRSGLCSNTSKHFKFKSLPLLQKDQMGVLCMVEDEAQNACQ